MNKPSTGKSLALYATLQACTLAFCWGWFALLMFVALVNFTLAQLEAWLLMASACAGLYGLRPNLERAIDHLWLGGTRGKAANPELAAQLKPIKRRIDLAFSLFVLALMLLSFGLWFGGVLGSGGPGLKQ